MTDTTRDRRAVLESSHRRLDAATAAMTVADLAGRSYCTDWSVAQVLSHVGSQAEIYALYLEAGLAGTDGPARDTVSAIWDRWNAMSDEEKARSRPVAEARFLDRCDAVDDEALARFQVAMFGSTADAARLLTAALSEHTVHTWDVAVMSDPGATLGADAAPYVLDGLGVMAGWVGKPQGTPADVEVVTSEPLRRLRLTIGETVRLAPGTEAAPPASLSLPAESLIRLVYGRLDREHTPASVEASGVELDALRAVFPGV